MYMLWIDLNKYMCYTFQIEATAQTKAEKIKLALEKLNEAKMKKVSQITSLALSLSLSLSLCFQTNISGVCSFGASAGLTLNVTAVCEQ